MFNPLVSVIIPAYNVEKVIIDALDSVYAQTYSPIEVIVIDDGSTDKTAKILKGCQTDKTNENSEINLTYMYQQNSGPSKARNAGIKTAKGEYIAFLDADDSWTEDKLKKQMQLFRRDQSIDIAFCDVQTTKVRKGEIETFFMFKRHKLDREFFGHDCLVINPLEKLIKINFMLTPAIIIKKSCFKNGFYFNEKRKYAEDWELWLKMSLYYKFGYISDVCVHVRDEGDGLCSQSDRMLLSAIEVMEDFIGENLSYISSHIPKDKFSNYLKDTYKWAGYHFMLNKNRRLARYFYKKSLKEAFDIKTVFYYLKSI